MDVFRIRGGVPLLGTVAVSGAKNAALPIMAASILADGPVRLNSVPDLADVRTMGAVLERLGLAVSLADESLLIEPAGAPSNVVPAFLAGRMRASFCVLGPLLARRGRARVALPGGCAIGHRPVDLHLAGLAALGAKISVEDGFVVATARRLRGAQVNMSGPMGPTVTGTANVMSAAVLARGETIITGAAREPEVVDLGRFLNRLGARISGLGTSTIRLEGVTELHGTHHEIIPDRIEAATLLIAGAITGGRVAVEGADPPHLARLLEILRSIGLTVESSAGTTSVAVERRLRSAMLTATPYPGIPTDLQSQLMALLCLARGTSVVRDQVFPERFGHVAELNRLGARIEQRDSSARVHGMSAFVGGSVVASDLRASAALVLAGLAASGETVIHRIDHLDRGYAQLDSKLQSLGARIERLQVSGEEIEPKRVPRALPVLRDALAESVAPGISRMLGALK